MMLSEGRQLTDACYETDDVVDEWNTAMVKLAIQKQAEEDADKATPLRKEEEGLVKLIEETVRFEHALSPHKPIYLVGDSFGGCLALAVASRNPAIDLVLIFSNPATSFGRSHLQPLFPILEAMPARLHSTILYLLGSVMVAVIFGAAAVNLDA
uniref:Serine aminopeptidase S33 domain-containing protein n=1 Tax=Quercus lobata TaxID=97700 RepID=A0A7N2R0I7_QUELO